MLVNRALNIHRDPLPRPVRTGKTKKDKASGSWGARFTNRQKPIRHTRNYGNTEVPVGGWGG